MHPQANRVIRSVFEYFKFKSPSWKKPHEKIFTLCFDEMHLDNLADLDKTLDMVIGPAKNGNILMVGSHTFGVSCLFHLLVKENFDHAYTEYPTHSLTTSDSTFYSLKPDISKNKTCFEILEILE